MLQRAASSAYSWWWASHIRTKQSKWLEQNLQDMEDKVGSMLGIIDEDGDSFARRAEMYYRKRPELVHLVEESFRAYRALAERYDHISRDLQSANRTIATVYPEKVHFSGMDDDDDEKEEGGQGAPKKLVKPKENCTLKPPIPNVPSIKSFKQLPTFKTKKWTQAQQQQQQKLKRTISSAKPVPCSGLSKGEALEEIDKLQNGILALQTEKEFVKSLYENAVAKYLEIETRITEMQVKVCGLQDEFGIGTVIEDNVARKLMVSTALKSCQETLNRLKQKQEKILQEAGAEQEKVSNALQKFRAFKVEYCGEQSDKQELGEITPDQISVKMDIVMPALQSLEEKIKELEDADANKSLTVTDLVDKINDIVDKVVNLETAVASSTAMVQRLNSEADKLHEHVQALETNKDQMAGGSDSDIIRQKMVELDSKMVRVHNLKQKVEDQNTSLIADFTRAGNSLDQLAEKVKNFKFDEMDEIAGWNVDGKYGSEQIMPAGKHSKISERVKGEKFLDVVSQVLSTSSAKSKPCNSPNVNEEGQKSEPDGEGHENIMSIANGLGISCDLELEQTKSDQLLSVGDDPGGSCTRDEHAESTGNGNPGEEGENGVEDHVSPNKVLETAVVDQSSSVFDAVNDDLLPDDSAQLGVPEREHIVENEEQQVSLALPEATNQDQSVDTMSHSIDKSFSEHQSQDLEDRKQESGLYADTENRYQERMESVIPDRKTNANSDSPSEEQENEELKVDDGRSSWRKLVENKEGKLDWRRLFLSSLEDREKFLVDEYTSVIKTLKEARRKLNEVEKKSREGLTEQTSKMKQIMHANSLKDKEIQSLRRTLSLLKLNNTGEKEDTPLPEMSQSEKNEEAAPPKEPELLISELEQRSSNDAVENTVEETQHTRLEINLNDEPPFVSNLEEKFRSDLDEMLGENLEFWLRFCTSVHQIQKFQSSIEDLQIEAARLMESKKQGSNSKTLESLKSDAKPIYKHLKDIQAELNLWLQHNSMLKEELESRHSSLLDIEEDITRVSNVTEDSELSEYQAAKFQGEVANMKQENNKVSDELQSCVGRVKRLEADIDKMLFKLNEEFGISESERKHSGTKVPLRTFLFGVKLKKQKHSFFRCISPSLQKQYSDLASVYPPPR